MDDIVALRRRVESAERQVRRMFLLLLVVGLSSAVAAMRSSDNVLRVRGVVILDAAGRERIVLGAPMNNVTTNAYVTAMTGMAVLDSTSLLNVAVGVGNPAMSPGGQVDRRIGSAAGLTIYDPRNGAERGGMGTFQDGRANVCLDYAAKPKEAVCMSVAAGDAYSAVMLNGTPKEPQFDRVGMFLGADGVGIVKAFGGGANESGIMMRGGKGEAALMVVDSGSKQVRDLARGP